MNNDDILARIAGIDGVCYLSIDTGCAPCKGHKDLVTIKTSKDSTSKKDLINLYGILINQSLYSWVTSVE